jgi:hypothetical protein
MYGNIMINTVVGIAYAQPPREIIGARAIRKAEAITISDKMATPQRLWVLKSLRWCFAT